MDEYKDVTAETNIAPQGEITDRKQAEVARRENEEQRRLAHEDLARRGRPVLLGTVLLSLAIFLLDCLTPVGYSVWPLSVWPLYLIPLMLTARTRERQYPSILAGLCTVLVVLGFFFTSPGIYPLVTVFRRAIGVSILWTAAVLLVRRMRVEEVSREQRDLLSEAQRVAHIGNWRYYLTGRITWSDETYRIYGCSPDTFTPNLDSFLNLIHPEDRAGMQAWFAACVAGEKPGELEFRAVLPDGRVRIIKARGDLRYDSDKRPAYIAGTAQDITEQKQAEEALQAVEDRLRRGRMGTFDWDIAHDRLTWSRGLEVLFGAPGQFSGTCETFAQRVHPADLPGVNAEIARCMAARDSYAREYRVVWPDGSVHWMAGQGEFTFSDAGQAVRMRGVVLDITERKQREEERDKLLAILDQSPDLVGLADVDGTVLYVNRTGRRMIALEGDKEAAGRNMCEFIAPSESPEVRQAIVSAMRAGQVSQREMAVTHFGGGVPVVLEVRAFGIFDHDGKLIGYANVSRDVTERKRAEGVQNWLASFPKLDPSPIVEADLTGRVSFLNPAAERLFPDMESRGVAHPWLAGLEDVERTCRASEIGKCVREVRIGEAWYYQVAFLVPSTQHLRLYGFDITDRKRAEQARDWIFTYSLDMLCVAGFDGYFKRVSPSFKKVLGWSEKELLFKPLLDFIHPDDRESSLQAAKALEVGKAAINLVNRHRCKDGSYKWISWNAYPLVQKQIIIGVARDITDHKRAEEALRISENKFASIFRSSPDAIVLTTVAEGRFLEVNDQFTRLTGYARDEVLGRTVFEIGVWSDPTARKQLVSLIDQSGGVREFEWKMLNKSGELRSVEFSGEKIELGGQACLVCIWRDITERQRAWALLRRQALMLENIHDAVIVVDDEYNITDWNPAATRMYGYEKTEVLGRNVSCLHAPEAAERQLLSIAEGLESAGRWDGELAKVRKDGTRFMVRSVIVPFRNEHGTQIGIIGVSRDISERKRAEEVLRASEARLREYERVVEGLDEMIAVIDREYRYVIANGAFLKYRGLTSEELIGRRISDILGPGVFERIVKAKLDGCFQGIVVKYEMTYTYPKLGERELSISYFPIEGPAGVDRVACVLQDVTERKRAERALQDSEEKYRILFESNPQPMWVYHVPSLRFLAVNQSAIRHYGYTREEFLAMTLRDIRPPEDIPAMEQSALHSPSHDRAGTWRHRTKDGRTIYVDITDCRVDFEGQTASLVLANDVTERHFLEEELRRAQKMEAVGRLAGGVAHDFNNVLMAIQMNGSLLAGDLVPPDRLQEKARDILASAERGAALTRQLLAFGRKQVLEPMVVDLNDLLGGILSLMQGLIPENIAMTASLCKSLGLVKVDPTQFEHVMINLVTNASDAMPRGGRLIIETSNVDASEHTVATAQILPPGQYVMVAVSDTGIGMDASTQARIFEPFFTTKLERGGTGLGLATSYGAVRQSGGYIFVYSERGQGTTFKVYFPTVGGEPKAVATVAEQDSVRGHGEAILLVEDEDLVRKAAAEFLSAYGYVVLEARNGPEALKLAMSYSLDIAAVVTDMIMPGIDGREVVDILRQLRPQLKAVLMSGYTETTVGQEQVGQEQEAASFTFLQKPFTAKVLAKTLRKVISGS